MSFIRLTRIFYDMVVQRLANNAGLRSPGEVEPSKKVLREKHPAHVIPVAMEDLTAEDVIVA
jgi:hypothetical protein